MGKMENYYKRYSVDYSVGIICNMANYGGGSKVNKSGIGDQEKLFNTEKEEHG